MSESVHDVGARRMFQQQPFMAYLGAELTLVEPGRAAIRLPYRRELAQHDGFFHGGIVATLADNAGGAAAYTLVPPGFGALTVELKVNLLAPGVGEALVARGEVIRAGKRLVVSRSDVFAVREGKETLCATCLMTLMVVDNRASTAGKGDDSRGQAAPSR
jgi:uncharacterized protein (TIGR00369 family)